MRQSKNRELLVAAWRRGRIIAFCLAALGSILSIPKNFSLDVAEIYWQRCLESGQRLDDVNQTHLVLASATKNSKLFGNHCYHLYHFTVFNILGLFGSSGIDMFPHGTLSCVRSKMVCQKMVNGWLLRAITLVSLSQLQLLADTVCQQLFNSNSVSATENDIISKTFSILTKSTVKFSLLNVLQMK